MKIESELFKLLKLRNPFFSRFNELNIVSWILNDWVIFLLERDVIQALNKTDPGPLHRVPAPTTRLHAPPPPMNLGFSPLNFDCIKRVFLIVLNMQYLKYVLYSLISLPPTKVNLPLFRNETRIEHK